MNLCCYFPIAPFLRVSAALFLYDCDNGSTAERKYHVIFKDCMGNLFNFEEANFWDSILYGILRDFDKSWCALILWSGQHSPASHELWTVCFAKTRTSFSTCKVVFHLCGGDSTRKMSVPHPNSESKWRRKLTWFRGRIRIVICTKRQTKKM